MYKIQLSAYFYLSDQQHIFRELVTSKVYDVDHIIRNVSLDAHISAENNGYFIACKLKSLNVFTLFSIVALCF